MGLAKLEQPRAFFVQLPGTGDTPISNAIVVGICRDCVNLSDSALFSRFNEHLQKIWPASKLIDPPDGMRPMGGTQQ